MHVAAKEGHDYTVRILVKKRANINIKDKFGVSFTEVWMISAEEVNYSDMQKVVFSVT